MAMKHKHLVLDDRRIRRAKKLLGTTTDTETVQKALDEVILERERNQEARKAHEEFLSAEIAIEDIYGLLER